MKQELTAITGTATLKGICKAHNLYTLSDIPEQWKQSRYFERIENDIDETPQFLKDLQGYESAKFYECRVQDEGTKDELYYIEHHRILVKKEGSGVVMRLAYDSRAKKYHFHVTWEQLRQFDKMDSYKRQEAIKGISEPNYIGVFSSKKVDDWAQYCEDYMKAMLTANDELSAKNTAIEQKIQSFIDSVQCDKIQSRDGITWVNTPLFEVKFNHSRASGHLHHTVTFKGELSDIIHLQNLAPCIKHS